MSKQDRFAPTAEELALEEDYENALDDAEKKGEPWFSLGEFKARSTTALLDRAEALDTLADNEVDDEAEYHELRARAAKLRAEAHGTAVPEVVVGDEEIPF